MAVDTLVGGIDMNQTLAGGGDTVMAGDTGLGNVLVIEGRRYPCRGGMTGIALGQGRYVVQWLAVTDHTIMTA